MNKMLLDVILAVSVIFMGLYALVFSKAAASWAVGLDGKLFKANLHENIYRAGFTIVGISFMVFGFLAVLLVA